MSLRACAYWCVLNVRSYPPNRRAPTPTPGGGFILVSLSPQLAATCAGVFSFLWAVTVVYGSYSRHSQRVVQVGDTGLYRSCTVTVHLSRPAHKHTPTHTHPIAHTQSPMQKHTHSTNPGRPGVVQRVRRGGVHERASRAGGGDRGGGAGAIRRVAAVSAAASRGTAVCHDRNFCS